LERIDWSKTRAYSAYYAGININLRDRESSGSVEPSEYERVRQEIIKRALQLRDKEGRRVVEGAHRVEEIYDNPPMTSFPDIVLMYRDMEYQNRPEINLGLSKEIFTKWRDSGGHRREGIFLAYGSGIKEGCRVDSAKIHDLAPTILHIFGLPVPRDMDGRVLKEIFQEKSEPAGREVIYQEPETADEKEELRERIKERIRGLKATRRI
jgi:predicted AlkP superfamily phosphohydrolase/phosphomutase